MTMMQPDPTTEFRKEKEFRAKVYRMLSLGLDTTEIETLLRQEIDWSLFSQETLRDIVEHSAEKSIPKVLDYALGRIYASTALAQKKIDMLPQIEEKRIRDLNKLYQTAFNRKLRRLEDLIMGGIVATCGFCFIMSLIIMGLIATR